MKPIIFVTAAQERLLEEKENGSSYLLEVLKYYTPLDWDIIVALPRGVSETLSRTVEGLSERVKILEVSSQMKGALATAVFAISKSQIQNSPIFIVAGDTYFTDESVLSAMEDLAYSGKDAGIVVIESSDPRFSYISLSDSGKVKLVTEKLVTGKFATTGIFFFANPQEFMKASKWCFINRVTYDDRYYVSGAVNYFIYLGRDIGYRQIESECMKKRWL